MENYKILDHTADLRLEVYGKTLEGLFINAAEALAQILHEQSESAKFSASSSEKIKLQSSNTSALLVDFLNEILAKSNIEKQIYKVNNLKLKDNSLKAEIVGQKVDKFDEDVKAVTYHEVDIKKEDDIWKTLLVLDI